jgi:hypothetical protein
MREIVTIVKVRRVKPGRIHVYFANGEVRMLDLKRYARKGTVFESLADPVYASKCRVVDNGNALRWPGGMDFSAGALLKSGSQVVITEGGEVKTGANRTFPPDANLKIEK